MTAISNTNSGISQKVLILREKIHDDEYINFAIQRIGQVLSKKIVEDVEKMYSGRKNES